MHYIHSMNPRFQELARRQFDAKIQPFRALLNLQRPAKGWIRALREALGMTTREFATRLKVNQSSAVHLETAEAANAITLASLAKAAEALDGVLVYAIIPRKKVEETVRHRARQIADQLVGRVSSSMQLEAQGLEAAENQTQAERLADEILAKPPRGFWK
jgi:predicted DNA-binding mobile mystery protein A